MNHLNLIFPHQLFEKNPLFQQDGEYVLIEEWLFFSQYPFHKSKIVFHRASMKFYESYLNDLGFSTSYIDATSPNHDCRVFIDQLGQEIDQINCIHPTDNWLQKHLLIACEKKGIKLNFIDENPLFINHRSENKKFFRTDKKKYFQTSFYKDQRKKFDILLKEGQPIGGKWSFDDENRLKYPKTKQAPHIHLPKDNQFVSEARQYVKNHFAHHYGQIPNDWFYPTTFKESIEWMHQFFQYRFHEFGHYEDAIVAEETFLHHSVLSPMINTGLLPPRLVIDECLRYHEREQIPINSLEGFIRQIIGWREFIRGVYEAKGSEERTKNYWGFSKPIPKSFYEGTTGIPPIDRTIKKVLATGYCHHIERLMVLSNFMLLCEFDPDQVYQWFMELFIDAYDWVMVPNVYGMGQFADGGLMSTKPYISSSNYLKKMSNYKKGEWQSIWDALFWRFMHVHRDFFSKNPRLGMIYRSWDKKSNEEQHQVIQIANNYLQQL